MRESDEEVQEEEGRLARSRRDAEERLADLRSSMGRELGTAPKKAYLLLLLAAGATGFAIAMRRFRRRRLRQ
jgi:hypothetical protein